MSAPEGFYVLRSENKPVEEKLRVEKTVKGSLGGATRKKLGDISNLQQPKPLTKVAKEHPVSGATTEEIDHLRKENLMLSKLLVEKNKIIDLAGVELQKLRVHVQKLQQQNSQIAQSNSQMLMEVNTAKERVRVLQHELGCANCLLKATKVMVEEKAAATETCHKTDAQEGTSMSEEAKESLEADRDLKKPCTTKRKQQSRSLGSSAVEEVQLKVKTENTRVLRRQSARFKSEEQKPTEDTFDAKPPMTIELMQEDASSSTSSPERHNKEETDNLQTVEQMQEDASTSTTASSPVRDDNKKTNHLQTVERVQEEGSTFTSSSFGIDEKESSDRPSVGTQVAGRTSLRPSRQAAQKVRSYKEIPLTVKMRRPE